MEDSHPGGDGSESPSSTTTGETKRGGGWITFPFIIAGTAGMTVASGGWVVNLIVYLIEQYKVKSIDAAQISNLVNAFTSLIPVLAAIIADSFAGCFSVISISSFFSLLGILLLFITTMFHSSTSQQCKTGSANFCKTPSTSQFAVLYIGIVLATLGTGGTRTTLSTMGADQFNKPKEQSIFFNWFFFTWYIATLIAVTAIVYVEDNVTWSWGFGLCAGANVLGLVIFLAGSKLYRHVKPKGSPFIGIARVIVATIRKRRALISMNMEDYYHGDDAAGGTKSPPTKSFRFLNCAALRAEGDTNADGSIAKPWNLCTVQQVEDFKTVIKIAPLWSSSAFLHTPIAIQASLSILQALTMDRNVSPHFQISAGSILVFVFTSTAICLTLFDRVLRPTWKYLIGRPLTPLQRIGIGHVLNVTSMALSAIVESRRLGIAHSKHLETKPGSIVPMSVLWLVPQLVFVGLGEAFHYPGQTALYYQEFPTSLKTLATALISLIIAVAYYLSTALVDLVRRVTDWLPDDLNTGRLDLVYWALVVIGVLNFGYFLVCAWLYEYQVKMVSEDDSIST